MSHTKDMIEVRCGHRSADLGALSNFMTHSAMPSRTLKAKRTPRSVFSGWSSSSSESSESQDGDHHQHHPHPHQEYAKRPSNDDGHGNAVKRQSHDLEVDPFAAEFVAAPLRQNHAIFSRSERRKLQRIETWAEDVEAQTMRRPLLTDKDRPMPEYMTFDGRERVGAFRRAYSASGSTQASSFDSMLARFGTRRPRVLERSEPIGWWWPWVVVALLGLVLCAVGLYELSQQPYRQDSSRHQKSVS